MKIVVTGSSGHLGDALVRNFRGKGHEVIGIDLLPSPQTHLQGSISDAGLVDTALRGADVVFHAATLHKPHVATHHNQDFIDVNVKGTQTLLDAAVKHGLKAFVFTSTTSTFGRATDGTDGAVWVTEDLRPHPKNIYGVTKVAAEDLCQLVAQDHGLPVVVLKTSRFFPEDDDMSHTLQEYAQDNIKAMEFLYRRVDIEDVVTAHERAWEKAAELGFAKFIISASTPFAKSDGVDLRRDLAAVLKKYHPDYERIFAKKGWKLFPSLSRVYVNQAAREKLGWKPKYDFAEILRRLDRGETVLSPLAQSIGAKGYHRSIEDC